MLLTESESLRDVLAFPKTARGNDLMTGDAGDDLLDAGAPGPVDDRQLADLKIKTV